MKDDPTFSESPLWALSRTLAADDELVVATAERAAKAVNKNLGKNTYLVLDDVLEQAKSLPSRFPDPHRRPLLYGLPISIKDCFDRAGTKTTAGSRYYAQTNPPARADSWVVERLRSQGALIVGKTHMQELAYGITGENPWFGDCLQPDDPTLLTGGSSSGAAASVQEGSAVAAIGTDTGGSVRVPAALCGLTGYRSSLGLGSWQGAMHLSESFDTIGWLFRDLRDGPLLASALFDIPLPAPTRHGFRIGLVGDSFVEDSEPIVKKRMRETQQACANSGQEIGEFDPKFFEESLSIFTTIQASEAADLHRGHFDEFETAIADRLRWGAGLSGSELALRRLGHGRFRANMNGLFRRFDFLMWPGSPLTQLIAGQDHQQDRGKLLSYTVPVSLGGLPAVLLPDGMQLIGRHGDDGRLLSFAAATVSFIP